MFCRRGGRSEEESGIQEIVVVSPTCSLCLFICLFFCLLLFFLPSPVPTMNILHVLLAINPQILQFVARVLQYIAGHTVRVKQHE
jgi:hypothetical protein